MSTSSRFAINVLRNILHQKELRLSDYAPTKQGASLRFVGGCGLKLLATCSDPSLMENYFAGDDSAKEELETTEAKEESEVVKAEEESEVAEAVMESEISEGEAESETSEGEEEPEMSVDELLDIQVEDAQWTFTINSLGLLSNRDSYDEIEVQHTWLKAFVPSKKGKTNQGITFEGDFHTLDSSPPIFKEKTCSSIQFCAEKIESLEYHAKHCTLALEWSGKLYRGGKDVDEQKKRAAGKLAARKESTAGQSRTRRRAGKVKEVPDAI